MTTLKKTKFKKSDDSTNIYKYRVKINLLYLHYFKIHENNHVKMSKINMLKIDVWTSWSQLSSCYAFHIVPNFIRNYHTKCLN